MRIFIKTKPNSKENKVVPPKATLFQTDEKNEYTVFVKEPPKEGKANDAVIKVLAEYFNVSRSQVTLRSGATSKRKVFEILD